MTLGNYLKNRRLDLGLKQEDVAIYLKVPKGTVSKWENGLVTEIGRTNIKLLSEILKIDPITIVEWDCYNEDSTPHSPTTYSGTDLLKKEISNLATTILNKTDDISKLELLKKVLISFDD
jgi:transcriptional regulator with XRE-family HTH domain